MEMANYTQYIYYDVSFLFVGHTILAKQQSSLSRTGQEKLIWELHLQSSKGNNLHKVSCIISVST